MKTDTAALRHRVETFARGLVDAPLTAEPDSPALKMRLDQALAQLRDLDDLKPVEAMLLAIEGIYLAAGMYQLVYKCSLGEAMTLALEMQGQLYAHAVLGEPV